MRIEQNMTTRCVTCRHSVVMNDGSTVKLDCAAACAHVEPPQECARDEAVLWLAQFYAGADHDDALAWMLAWAQRRQANLAQRAAEFLADLSDGDELHRRTAANLAKELIGNASLEQYLSIRQQRRGTVAEE